jgi:hypothetical protein
MKQLSTSNDFVRVFATLEGDDGAKLVFEAWHAKRPVKPENVQVDVAQVDGKVIVTARATPHVTAHPGKDVLRAEIAASVAAIRKAADDLEAMAAHASAAAELRETADRIGVVACEAHLNAAAALHQLKRIFERFGNRRAA